MGLTTYNGAYYRLLENLTYTHRESSRDREQQRAGGAYTRMDPCSSAVVWYDFCTLWMHTVLYNTLKYTVYCKCADFRVFF